MVHGGREEWGGAGKEGGSQGGREEEENVNLLSLCKDVEKQSHAQVEIRIHHLLQEAPAQPARLPPTNHSSWELRRGGRDGGTEGWT